MTGTSDQDPPLEKTVQDEEEDQDERLADLKVTFRERNQPPVQTWSGPQKFDPLLGKIIGSNYKVQELVGEGGMSRVYKAKHLLLNRPVALKFIHPKYVYDIHQVKRFKQEAQAATALKHPNICSVNEFGMDAEGRSYLVMDFIKGDTLSSMLDERRRVPVDEALDIVIQVASGLEHAHSKGVIHRDITPGNIVIVKDRADSERVKLVDFGIAKLMDQDEQSKVNLTKTGEVFGTPAYMSPEQCLAKPIDARSDLYSLGCVFYELLTGKTPFPGDNSMEVLMAHITNDPPTIPMTVANGEVRDVVAQCLRKEPEHRYQTATQLKEDLTSIKNGEKPAHLKAKLAASKTRFSKRNFLLATVAGCIFAFQCYEILSLIQQQQNIVLLMASLLITVGLWAWAALPNLVSRTTVPTKTARLRLIFLFSLAVILLLVQTFSRKVVEMSKAPTTMSAPPR